MPQSFREPAPPARLARKTASTSLLAAVALIAACAGSSPGILAPATSPFADASISQSEAALRHYLVLGDTARVKQAIAGLPGDTLLRLLNWGLAWHRLGQFQKSNVSLQAATKIADDRYTRSVSQNLGAFLVNDRVMNYSPGAHERAFIHYYGMLNYLALGNTEDALVEARAVDEFLRKYARENGARSFTRDATVEYLAGMLHLGAGDPNDAMDSFRSSVLALDSYSRKYGISLPQFVGADVARLATTSGISELATQVTTRYQLKPDDIAPTTGLGSLVVLVENGFIAYREEEKVYIPILPSEAEGLVSSSVDTAALLIAPAIIERTVNLFAAASSSNREYGQRYQNGMLLAGVEAGADFFMMAWPKYVLNTHGADDITVVAGTARQSALVMDDLSAIAVRAFEEEKPRIINRMIVRGLIKYGGTKYAEKKAKEQGDKAGGFGELFGALGKGLAQVASAATEQADTRSWSLLPGEVRVARFLLPPGKHDVSILVQNRDGTTRTIALGPVTIEANKVAVRTQFVDGSYRGGTTRFTEAQHGVDYKAALDVSAGEASLAPGFGADGRVASVTTRQAGAAASPPIPAGPPRAAVTILAVTPISGAFHPLMNEGARFAVRMRNPTTTGQRASTSLLVVRPGSSDTVTAWTGAEGDTAVWNGMIGSNVIDAGPCTFIWQTTTPGAPAPSLFVAPAVVEVDRLKEEALPTPPDPSIESESRMVMRPDYDKKHSKVRKGLILGTLGAALTTGGYVMAKNALETTAPGSPARMSGLGVWIGGVTFSTIATIVTGQGLFKGYDHPVSEADMGAVDRNKTAREDHARAMALVTAQRERFKTTTVVRIRMAEGH